MAIDTALPSVKNFHASKSSGLSVQNQADKRFTIYALLDSPARDRCLQIRSYARRDTVVDVQSKNLSAR
ncbi:hypothetical protein ACNKHU_06335 [Shigella flexneri]